MKKGNVLVIGNCGVGKSTLINAVLGDKKAETGWGTEGITKDLKVYECDSLDFRVIDTMGFEPSMFKVLRAINAIKKWSKNSIKAGHEDTQINEIWFCIDGTSRKLFPEAIKNLSRATSMWKTVPVIVVITKSYSILEREQNVEMVHHAFATMKHYSVNLKKVIPVVAETYQLNENAYAAPDGIAELISETNKLMPEGIKASEKDIKEFILSRKRALAHTVTVVATTAGTVVGAIPVPVPDALILGPTEVAEINAIASIYEIKNDEQSKRVLNSIVEAGTVSAAAKTAINAIKALPGIGLAASAINAIVAGCIVASLGEGAIYVFEQIYLGNKSVNDIDWISKVMESAITTQIVEKGRAVIEQSKADMEAKDIAKVVVDVFGHSRRK